MLRYRLRQLLDDTGTSQLALAASTGISKTTINDLCRSEPVEKIDTRTLFAIAAYFGVAWSYLLEDDGLPYPPRRWS